MRIPLQIHRPPRIEKPLRPPAMLLQIARFSVQFAFAPGETVRTEHMNFSTHCRQASKRGIRNVDLPLAWHFIRHFVRNPASVGAIAPSSPRLARAMMRDLALAEGDNVLELGPGTGSFTREIKRCLPESASYLGIECESKFVELLPQVSGYEFRHRARRERLLDSTPAGPLPISPASSRRRRGEDAASLGDCHSAAVA